MDESHSDELKKYLKVLDENIDILSGIELELDDQKEDELATNLELHNLYDMTEDLAESAKLKRAEFNHIRRKLR